MSLTEASTIRQIEIAYVNGAPAILYREMLHSVLRDGVEVAASSTREVLDFNSDEARAVLGDSLVGALAQVQALTTEIQRKDEVLASLIEDKERVHGELAHALAQIAALQAVAAQPLLG